MRGRLLTLLSALPMTVLTFTLLPYIQIDYAHYFRLAQCQAKCGQKYGVPSTRSLLDGSIEQYLDVHNQACEQCESGCQQHRRLHKVGNRRPAKTPLEDGVHFWPESSAIIAKAGSTLVAAVELLCQNPSVDEEFGDSSEGLVVISLLRPSASARFIVQWKHRIQGSAAYEESQWITASIESSTVFKVKGLMPGVQYRFMVTAIGPSGRLGETVASTWTEISNSAVVRTPEGSLTLRNGYNSENGVTVNVEWLRTPQDSCYYRIQLSNSTAVVNEDITLDSFVSVLMPHLEFETEYTVNIIATSADKNQMSKPLSGNFKSIRCKDVHGQGSIQCVPEPVLNLSVVLRPNGTGIVSWVPSAEQENILFYQLIYYALQHENGCRIHHETLNVKAASTSVTVDFPGQRCEYVVRLINYDLIGRDAVAEIRVLVELEAPTPRLDVMFQSEIVIIPIALVLFFCLCMTIRCFCSRNCPSIDPEKQDKLNRFV